MLVIVCQGKSCRKYGANKVLKAFQENQLAQMEIRTQFCLGQCGNGPMIVILPEKVWYDNVDPEQVPLIINKHFQ
jgi:(2Fe-2S) ferredoxin